LPLTRRHPDVVEAELAVSPVDPDFLVAASMSTDAEFSLVYASREGGVTWSQGTRLPGGDPTFAFDDEGTALFTTITPEVRVWSSADGLSWMPWAATTRSFDRQWIAADPTGEFGVVVDGRLQLLASKLRIPPASGVGRRP
jgi:hypothetical protein